MGKKHLGSSIDSFLKEEGIDAEEQAIKEVVVWELGQRMNQKEEDTWPTAEMRASSINQAKSLRQQAQKGGLRFDVYLPPRLAEWLLELIEQGVFIDPSEAVFVMLGEQHDLAPHQDLRQELLKRLLQARIDDPRPALDGEVVFARLREQLTQPPPAPAMWQKPHA